MTQSCILICLVHLEEDLLVLILRRGQFLQNLLLASFFNQFLLAALRRLPRKHRRLLIVLLIAHECFLNGNCRLLRLLFLLRSLLC